MPRITIISNEPTYCSIVGAEIPTGAFRGIIIGPEKLYLRCYDRIVLLEDPRKTWLLDVTVTNYRPVNIEIREVD